MRSKELCRPRGVDLRFRRSAQRILPKGGKSRLLAELAAVAAAGRPRAVRRSPVAVAAGFMSSDRDAQPAG
jgi:hypothetical protein